MRIIKSEIPAERGAVLHFAGGMPARHYSIDKGGYDGRGKSCNGENYIDKFIEIMKELGNEQMYHIPQLQYVDPNTTYNAVQRLLGVPQRDAKNRAEIDGYYDNYVRIYQLHAALLNDISRRKGVALPAAVPMVTNTVPRWRAWNQRVATVPAILYGVFHHYEDQMAGNWKRRYDENLSAIRAQNNLVHGEECIPIATEWGVWFHDQGDRNLHLVGQYKTDYERWFRAYSQQQKVPLIMQHRLNGDPNTWGDGSGARGGSTSTVPYDRKMW